MKLQDILSNKFIVYPVIAIISYFVFSNMWLLAMLLVVFDSIILLNHYNDNSRLNPKDYLHLALSVPLYLSLISFVMPSWFATIPAVCFAVKSICIAHDIFGEKLNHTYRQTPSY